MTDEAHIQCRWFIWELVIMMQTGYDQNTVDHIYAKYPLVRIGIRRALLAAEKIRQ